MPGSTDPLPIVQGEVIFPADLDWDRPPSMETLFDVCSRRGYTSERYRVNGEERVRLTRQLKRINQRLVLVIGGDSRLPLTGMVPPGVTLDSEITPRVAGTEYTSSGDPRETIIEAAMLEVEQLVRALVDAARQQQPPA